MTVRWLFVLALLVPVVATSQPAASVDSAVVALVSDFEDGEMDCDQVFTLLATLQRQPERIQALGHDSDDMLARVLEDECLRAEVERSRRNSPPGFPRPVRRTAAERGSLSARRDSLLDVAIQNAESDTQRADFYYIAGDYDRAVEADPTHLPSLSRRAGQFGERVGRPSTVEGRAAYWCLADVYDRILLEVEWQGSYGSIGAAARRAAAGYRHAAPTAAQALEAGWTPGQRITVALEDGGTCVTTVR